MSSIKDIVKSTNIANTIGAGQGLLNKYGISNILGTKTIPAEVGTGLGLSIVRGIIEKHGGKVCMASEQGLGTTFWFDLPLEQADADELQLQAERSSDISRAISKVE